MSDNRDIVTFQNTGINTDADILAIPQGDSRYRLNVTLSDDGNHAVLTNIKGNTLKTYSFTGGGTYKVVGSVEDKENSAIIYMVHDSSGNGYHSILRYNYNLDTFTDILKDESILLPTSYNNLVDFSIIGNQDDQYLIWTDQVNEPRMINILYAINYTAGVGSPAYSSLTVETIRFYKKPHLESINLAYGDSSTNVNNLQGSLWQFAVRKRFYDKTYSVLGPPSEILIPQNEENANGVFTEVPKNNEITIDVYKSSDDDLVDEYQVYYREVDVGEGASGSWYLIDSEPVDNTTYFTYTFTDNQTGTLLDDTEAERPYDYVPDVADHVTAIDTNRAVWGGITEGYDNIDSSTLDVTLSTRRLGNLESGFRSELYDSQTVLDTATSTSISTLKLDGQDFQYTATIRFILGGAPPDEYAQYVSTYNVTDDDVATELASQINSISGFTSTSSTNSFSVTNNSGYDVEITMIVLEANERYSSFKCGTKNYFGLQYYKDGKPWFVQRNDDFTIDVPYQYEAATTTEDSGSHTGGDGSASLTDSGASWDTNQFVGATVSNLTDGSSGVITSNTSTTITASLSGGTDDDWDNGDNYEVQFNRFNFINEVSWELDHLPPEGATHYQWMYLGNNVDEYSYVFAYSDTYITHEGQYTLISKEVFTDFVTGYGGDITYGFTVRAGDRVRFVGAASFGAQFNDSLLLYDELYDYEVLSVSDTDIKIRNIEQLTDGQLGGSVIEIYRPRDVSEASGIYQTISPVFEIYDDSGTNRHRGDTQDQTSSLPATGVFNPYYADAFVYSASFVNSSNASDVGISETFIAFMESESASVMYDSDVDVYGKINIINEFAEQKFLNKIRWGGKFLDESGVNFLTRYEFDDERFLDDRNGIINKIEQIGDTLKVYQERKVTSFYLKTTSSTDASGANTYVFDRGVMSEGRQTVYDYGCTNFESYVKNVRNAYFFDVINAYVVRDSPAGLEPVSDYGMHTFFKEKSAQILALGRENVKVLGMYDDDNDIYVISFIYSDMGNDVVDSLAFHEPTNKWLSHFTLPATTLDCYGRISGQSYTSFLQGQLYVHNSNNTRCNFWGSQYGSEVRVHSTINPNLIKIWDNIQIVSTGQWAPSSDGDVLVTVPNEQQSRLKTGKFELQEGEYRTEYLRDLLSGESTPQENNLFNGDALRGYEISNNLRNTDTTEANLRMVKINGTTST